MKSLNFLFVMAICFMAISRVSATYYIIKTFENYSSKDTNGKEGDLDANGLKRVDCFAGLIGSTVNQPDAIFYKADGTDKNGNIKVNSRKNTAEAIAAKLNIQAQVVEGGDAQLANIKTSLLEANQINNAIFVWSDKEKASALATALGATGVPELFPKENYGSIWVIDGQSLKEVQMNCDGLANSEEKSDDKSGSSANIRFSLMTVAVAVMASLYLLF